MTRDEKRATGHVLPEGWQSEVKEVCVAQCVCACRSLGAQPHRSFSFSDIQTTMKRRQVVSTATAVGGMTELGAFHASLCTQTLPADFWLKMHPTWSKQANFCIQLIYDVPSSPYRDFFCALQAPKTELKTQVQCFTGYDSVNQDNQ